MSAPTITISTGNGRARGRRITLPPRSTMTQRLLAALEQRPKERDGWWSPAKFNAGIIREWKDGMQVERHEPDDYRHSQLWAGSVAIVNDVDNIGHAAWNDEDKQRVEKHIAEGDFPGSLAGLTPHGLRILLPLSEPTTDAAALERAMRGACAMTMEHLAQLPGLKVEMDEGASCDRARFFWNPRGIVDGEERDEPVRLIRDRDWALEELAAYAPGANSQRREDAPRTPPAAKAKKRHPGRHDYIRDRVAQARKLDHAPRALLGIAKGVYEDECEHAPPKNDDELAGIVDWVMANVTPTQPATPKPEAVPVEYLDLEKIAREGIPPVPWILPGWLAEKDVALVAGGGGIGKSTLVADLAIACATGRPWLGITPIRAMRVLFVDEEQGAEVVARLILRLGAPHENLRVASDQGIRLDSDEGAARLEREIAAWRPGIVFLDSAQQVFGKTEENDATAVGLVFGRIFRLRATYDCGFPIVHHKKKAQGYKVDILELVRGSTGFGTQASTVWFCESSGPGALNVTQAKRRGGTKTSVVALYREEGDRIVLSGGGPVEDKAGAVAGCCEWIIDHIEELDGPAKAAAIVEAAKRLDAPYSEDVVAKALKHGLKLGVLAKPHRGWYTIKARAPLTLSEGDADA